jgi:hypothetical protein
MGPATRSSKRQTRSSKSAKQGKGTKLVFFFSFVSGNAEHYVAGNHLSSVSGRTWWQIK